MAFLIKSVVSALKEILYHSLEDCECGDIITSGK